MAKPKIRFNGYTEEWEQRKLGATNTFFTDGNYGEAYPKLSDMTDSGSGVPFLTGGNLKDGKLSLNGASYITPEKHSKLTSGHLLEDDIVVAVRGSLGALGYVNTGNSGWNINSQLAILRTDKSELYGKFLIQYLLSWTGQNELLKRQTGSALKQLPIGAIKDVEVPITSIAEQEKIGEYFDSVDHLITLHQRKCEQTKTLKKYMLQKMFSQDGEKVPQIRFEGFTEDWEQRKLGDIAEFSKGSGYSKGDLIESGTPIILYGRLYTKYETSISEVDTYVEAKDGSVYSKGGEVIVPASGETAEDIARAATVDKSGVILGGDLNVVSPNEDINSAFLAISISHGNSQRELAKKAQGKSVVHIHNEEIKNLVVPFPAKAEQNKIVEYFSNLDDLITLHQRKCDELKEVKKFMLQNMFV